MMKREKIGGKKKSIKPMFVPTEGNVLLSCIQVELDFQSRVHQ